MNFSKRGLDERQRAYRDRVGHQCFLLLLYGILIDTALFGAGVKWLPYPANMMALLTACAGLYQVRIILGNAYLPPGESGPRRQRKTIILAAFSVALAALAAALVAGNSEPPALDAAAGVDISSVVLIVISAVSLTAAFVSGLVRRRRDREKDGE